MAAERRPVSRGRASWRWLAALALVACVDGPTSPGLYGELRIRPSYASGDTPSAIGLTVDSARVRIERTSGSDILVDSMVAYRSDTLSFGWILDLASSEEQVRVEVEIWDDGASLYSGDSVVVVRDGAIGGDAAEILVAYSGPPIVATIAVSPEASTLDALGATSAHSAIAKDRHGVVVPTAFTWSTGDAAVATVDAATGVVTSAGDGTTSVVAAAGGVTGAASITVAQRVATVSVSPASSSITRIGDTETLTASARDANGHVVAGAGFEWASSDADVATVDAAGVVTAKAGGSATITATSGGVSGSASVTVSPVESVASIVVTPASHTLTALGATRLYVAEARDANGVALAGITFTWTSSATDVASIDPVTGVATAVGHGSTTISASVNGVTGTAALAVNLVQSIASVAVSPTSASLTHLGATQQFTAVARDASNHVLPGVTFSWSSANGQVATVDPASGLATATGHGTTSIRASVGDVSGDATLSVNLEPALASIEVSPASTTLSEVGARQQFTAVARDAGNNVLPGVTFTWTSADEAVATVDANGRATAAGHGTTAIRATAGAVSGEAAVTVNLAPFVASVTVSPATATLEAPGATQQFTAVARDGGNNILPGVQFTWTSSATEVATVDPATGLATAAGQGTTTITATVNGVSGTATLDVNFVSVVASVEVSPASATLGALNATQQFTAVARDAANNALPGVIFTWSSGNEAVATVNGSGLATAAGSGTAAIRATAGAITGEALLTVDLAPSVASVTVSPTSTVFTSLGATRQFTATARDAANNVLPGVTFTWTSGNEQVTTVDATGLATATGHGSTEVVATANGVAGAATIAVNLTSAIDTIIVTPASVILTAVGATQQYVAEARDAQGRVLPGMTFSWTSSDESAGVVDPITGLATAVCHGETRIIASAGGLSGRAWLIVDLDAALVAARSTNVAAVIAPPPCSP